MPVLVEITRASARPIGTRVPGPVFDAARRIPGLKWDKASRSWKGYEDALEAFGDFLESENLASIVWDGRKQLPAVDLKPFARLPLTDYQKAGVEFLVRHAPTGVWLADDVGVGKTLQALCTSQALVETFGWQVIVVVCPAIMKNVWLNEIKKWGFGDHAAIAVSGTKPSAVRNPTVIINYDILHAWVDQLQPTLVIFDEIHMLMNERSRRSTAAKKLAAKAIYRIGLSATPLTRPRDLYNPIDTLSPGRFGDNAWPFLRRYCDAKKVAVTPETVIWDLNGKSNEDELGRRLKHLMLRRMKSEVLSELPPQTRQMIPVEVPSWGIAQLFATDSKDAFRRALDLSGKAKVPHAIALAESLVAQGEKVTLVTHLRATATAIAKRIKKAGLITGGMSVESRHAVINQQPPVIVATIDSIGLGIDLTAYSSAIVVDLDWVPSKLLQFEGRHHRRGQKRAVTIYYLIGLGTLDERIRETVLDRLRTSLDVLGQDDQVAGLEDVLQGGPVMDEEAVLAALRSKLIEGRASL